MPRGPVEVALEVIDVLDRLGVRYAIGGSFASSTWGVARLTQDIDLVAELGASQAGAFVAALADRFYVAPEAVDRAIRHRSSFNLIHLEEIYKVDVFVADASPLVAGQLARRREAVIVPEPERRAFVTAPEDIVLAKLAWFEAGGRVSERQWRDVVGVLHVQQARLDEAYLRQGARTASLLELLERAMSDARKPPGGQPPPPPRRP